MSKLYKKVRLFTIAVPFLVFSAATLQAQVKIGLPAGAAAASAVLDASNTGGANKGFLVPQVALTTLNAADPVTAPATGLMVYNTATAGTSPNNVVPGHYYWNGTQWVMMVTAGSSTTGGNIYSNDGTLAGNRTVTMAGNTLNFTGGNIGLGVPVPNAELQFSNTSVNRKIVLYDAFNDQNQYYGFGVNANVLRYQVDNVGSNHVFYAATSATTSNELMRITGMGRVGIGTTAPVSQLSNTNINLGDQAGVGINATSFNWIGNTVGYTAAVGNGTAGANFNGLLVKTTDATTSSRALSVTTGGIDKLTVLGNGFTGIGTNAPSTTLDVNGAARIRTVAMAANGTAISPLFVDGSGNVVKSPGATTLGAVSIATSANIASGASGVLTTNLADGGIYKAVVTNGDACADVSVAEYYITAISSNGYFAINGLGGILSSGTPTKSPTFTQTSRAVIATAWTGKVGCSGGDNSTSLNYTLTLSFATPTFTLTVTNNGNIAKAYNITLTRIN